MRATMTKEELKEFVLELQSFLRKWDVEMTAVPTYGFDGNYECHTIAFRFDTAEIYPSSYPTTNADTLDEFLANMNTKYYFGK